MVCIGIFKSKHPESVQQPDISKVFKAEGKARLRHWASSPSNIPRERVSLISVIIAKLGQWNAATDPIEQEQIETELEAMITDGNAGEILRQLPSEFLETPFAIKTLECWSRADPAAVLHWMDTDSNPMKTYVAVAVRDWIVRDVSGLNDYINVLPQGNWKQRVLAAAISNVLDVNLAEDAAVWLGQLYPTDDSPELLVRTAKLWAQKDFAAAVNWANAQTNTNLRDQLLANIAIGLAKNDLAGAIEFARQNLRTEAAANEVIQGIISDSGGENSETLANWLAELPVGETRKSALNTLLFQWANADLPQAQRWVSTQLGEGERQEFIEKMTGWRAQFDLPAAANLVVQMSPGQAQTDLEAGILRRWIQENRDAVNQWISQLPYDSKQSALASLAGMAAEIQTGANY